MDAQITVSVTDEDIMLGSRVNPEENPISLAVNREFPGVKAWTTPGVVIVEREGEPARWYDLPPEAKAFMDAIYSDDAEPLEPFTFTATLWERPKPVPTFVRAPWWVRVTRWLTRWDPDRKGRK